MRLSPSVFGRFSCSNHQQSSHGRGEQTSWVFFAFFLETFDHWMPTFKYDASRWYFVGAFKEGSDGAFKSGLRRWIHLETWTWEVL